MRELSLFTGGGGGVLGGKLLGWKSIGYVEINEFCQKLIAQRIEDGQLERAPIFGDIRGFIQSGAAREYRGFADVVTAGFPCQPFSNAGLQAGEFDPRNMWPQTLEVIRKVGPRFALLENVPGLLTCSYFGTILGDLADCGYNVRWRRLSASELGAPHQRERVWFLAYPNPNCVRCDNGGNPDEKSSGRGDTTLRRTERLYTDVADLLQNKRLPRRLFDGNDGKKRTWGEKAKRSTNWNGFEMGPAYYPFSLEQEIYPPDPDGMVDGVAAWLDRIEATGNGQVPLCAASAWKLLSGVV